MRRGKRRLKPLTQLCRPICSDDDDESNRGDISVFTSFTLYYASVILILVLAMALEQELVISKVLYE